MSIALIQTALELGLFGALTTLALFLSYSMLNVCDLSTDGCFTLGATVGAVVAIGGHPWLSIPAAMAAGILSGFAVALLQTKMGINSLLAGIIVNTALYSINIAVMDGSSVLNMNKTETVFTMARGLLEKLGLEDYNKLFVALIAVLAAALLLGLFLKTKLGLAIRATGNNPDMVRSSSVNTTFTTIVGLCLSNSLTALSGCLLAQSQKSVNIDIGTGMVTVALASLLIGGAFFGKRKIPPADSGHGGRLLHFQAGLHRGSPAGSAGVLAISLPYLKEQFPLLKRRFGLRKGRQPEETRKEDNGKC